jgi:hypothetical protein
MREIGTKHQTSAPIPCAYCGQPSDRCVAIRDHARWLNEHRARADS